MPQPPVSERPTRGDAIAMIEGPDCADRAVWPIIVQPLPASSGERVPLTKTRAGSPPTDVDRSTLLHDSLATLSVATIARHPR